MNNRQVVRKPRITLTVPEKGIRVMSRDNRHQSTVVGHRLRQVQRIKDKPLSLVTAPAAIGTCRFVGAVS